MNTKTRPFVACTALISAASAFAIGHASAHAGDALSVRDLAGEDSLLVVGADDLRGTIARMGPTALGRIWNDPAVADASKRVRENLEKGIGDAAAEAGLDREGVQWPASVGLALMVEMDEELGLPAPQYFFFCDWASEAEQATKIVDAIVARVEKGAKDRGQGVTNEEVRGRRVTVVDLAPKAADGGDGMGEGGVDGGGMGFGGPDLLPKQMCLLSDKGRFLVASNVTAMDLLLGRIDGDRAKSMGETELFRESAALAGGTQDIYAVFSTKAAQPMLLTMPQFLIAQPLVERFFGDIQAWSFGLHAKDGAIEVAQGIYVPGGKKGLLSLVDSNADVKPAPSVAPADALSYGCMQVRFDRMMPMLDEAIAGLPPDQGEMIKSQLDMYRPAMSAAFSALGPDVHLWSVEGNAAEQRQGGLVTAISMKNDKDSASAVSDFINLLPLGLQTRDFNGMTIMSDEFAPMAVGIGGGYLVIGDTVRVEQTLRSVDAKGEAGLAGDDGFKAGMGQLPKQAVAFAWFDLARQLSGTAGMMNGFGDRLDRMLEAMDGPGAADDGAALPGLEVGVDDAERLWTLLEPETVKRHLGPGLLDFVSEKSGFTTRYRIMPAAAQ